MKKLLTVLFLFMFIGTAYAETPITVKIDSSPITFDAEPRIISNRTMVPVRQIFEALGARVEWDGTTRTVTATSPEKTVKMTIGRNEIDVDGRYVLMDTVPVLIENRTFIPARFAAEVFENSVSWEGETRTVNISTATKPSISYYKQYTGRGLQLMYPAEWLLDESFADTLFIDNQPTSYDELGLGMISISAIEYVNSSFSDTVSARYDFLLNDCGYNVTEFQPTNINGYTAQVFRYVDAEGDFVKSYFVAGTQKAYYIEFITDHENAFADIFNAILLTIRLD